MRKWTREGAQLATGHTAKLCSLDPTWLLLVFHTAKPSDYERNLPSYRWRSWGPRSRRGFCPVSQRCRSCPQPQLSFQGSNDGLKLQNLLKRGILTSLGHIFLSFFHSFIHIYTHTFHKCILSAYVLGILQKALEAELGNKHGLSTLSEAHSLHLYE